MRRSRVIVAAFVLVSAAAPTSADEGPIAVLEDGRWAVAEYAARAPISATHAWVAPMMDAGGWWLWMTVEPRRSLGPPSYVACVTAGRVRRRGGITMRAIDSGCGPVSVSYDRLAGEMRVIGSIESRLAQQRYGRWSGQATSFGTDSLITLDLIFRGRGEERRVVRPGALPGCYWPPGCVGLPLTVDSWREARTFGSIRFAAAKLTIKPVDRRAVIQHRDSIP